MLGMVRKVLGVLVAPWLLALGGLIVFGPMTGQPINEPDTSTYVFGVVALMLGGWLGQGVWGRRRRHRRV